MPHDSISALKSEQVKLASRKSNLLELCIPFRDGLLERLEQFTTAAMNADLHDVKACRKTMHTNKILEVSFTLNGFDLLLMATDDVFPVDPKSEALASKMFIYLDGTDDSTPRIEIVVLGPVEGTYLYKMVWLTQGQPVHVAAGRSVTGKDGHAAGDALIHHICSFRTLWMERPTLGEIRQRKYETHAMGFQALKR